MQNDTQPTILRFRDSKSGETWQGTPQEAMELGISPEKIQSKLEATLKLQKTLETGDPGAYDADLKKKKDSSEAGETTEQSAKRKAAVQAVSELERIFGRGSRENIGTDKDLSLSKSASGTRKKVTEISLGLQSLFGTDNKLIEDVNKYKSQRDLAVGMLTQAFGAGTPQEAESARLIASAPKETSTDSEAKQWFESVNAMLAGEPVENRQENLGPEEPTRRGTGTQETSLIEKLMAPGGIRGIAEEAYGVAQKNAPAVTEVATDALLGRDQFENGVPIEAITPAGLADKGDIGNAYREVFGAALFQGIATGAADKVGGWLMKNISPKLPQLASKGGEAVDDVVKTVTTAPSGIKTQIVKIGEKIENSMPSKIARKSQIDEARKLSGVKIDPEPILAAGREMVEKVPALQKTFDTYEKLIKGATNPEELLKTLDFLGNAYTQNQRVKSGLSPRILKNMYEEALNLLKTNAPTVYENRALTRFALEIPKTAGKALWAGTLGRLFGGGL